KSKSKNYQPASFNSRFSNQNQTRNCWQNWTSTAVRRQCLLKGSLYPISWLSAWDDRQAEGIFPGKI
ncbi:hypothetical protein FD754_007647, partial [Muntiacus muntjak]